MRKHLFALLVVLFVAMGVPAAPNYFAGSKITYTTFKPDRPVVNGATYDDIRQTDAPTCSFLAALSAAAHSGIDLGSRVKYHGGNDYSVSLFFNGSWTEIHVPFDGWTSHDPAPNDAGEFWVALYQRAYLKAWNVDCSDADSNKWAMFKDGKKSNPNKDQDWQYSHNALRAVTGKDAEWWELNQGDPAATIKTIASALAQKRCVLISISDESGKKVVAPENCLVKNHAYTVLAAGPDYLDIRNPWGSDLGADQLETIRWNGHKPVYKFKAGFGDGKDNNPNDGILRVKADRLKYFTHGYATK